jgi:hypothetical protein
MLVQRLTGTFLVIKINAEQGVHTSMHGYVATELMHLALTSTSLEAITASLFLWTTASATK